MAFRYGWCGSMRCQICRLQECVGESGRAHHRQHAGMAMHPVPHPGMPNCSVRAATPPENGYCAMTKDVSSPILRQSMPKRQVRRILAIWLARLSVDRWRLSNGVTRGEGADALPTALITETAHGPRRHCPAGRQRRVGGCPRHPFGKPSSTMRALIPLESPSSNTLSTKGKLNAAR